MRVSGAAGAIELEAALDEAVADRAVRVAAAFEQTAALGGAFGQISVERV
ncbi:NADH-ubiquinone oxidoreductase%2C 75 kDa subunit [Bordetella pertussis]|nr:NADH-ubiquinone oxidoreductase%2C 75 kDa subunit [Bordetella pertussis]CFO93480.1 NADH-ubiquinone oxidoreductase%2C 75 kDa subunit [Bordetella pertussis]CFW53970.1 NADH-ubiquinone oxidoreductase%2C 75 kDa subunit [Bordetella pertussis]CPI17534.1 NADH-ubiquinone oxidoreductase%2C 75 kDa subunit [Bordetella pertussis]CPI40897.1 NADH-ubiquinone oxidoreductase%2C 75 kDa subunit [Bordetella pertussis]